MPLNLAPKHFKHGLLAGVIVSVAVVAGVVAWSVEKAPYMHTQRAVLVPQTMASLPPVVIAPPIIKAAPPPVETAIEQDVPPPADKTEAPETPETLQAVNANPALAMVTPPAPDIAQLTPPNVANAAWQTNAASFDGADTRPRLALMVADLGLAASVTDAAISMLPPQISLSFWANAPSVDINMAKARADGHEVFLAVPMEPENFPQNDAGPNSLLTTLPDAENMARLQAHLSKAQNYVGIVPAMGGQFVTARDKLAPIMAALQQQGFMVVDTTQAPQSFITSLARTQNMPFIKIDRVIDAALGEEAWQAQLNGLVQLAKTNGRASAVIMPYPAAFKQLAPFLADLPNKGIVLAPMSALVK